MRQGSLAFKLFGAFSLACILTLISQSGALRPTAEADRTRTTTLDPPRKPLPELEELVPAAFDEGARLQLEAADPERLKRVKPEPARLKLR